jgi:hypothetical protein
MPKDFTSDSDPGDEIQPQDDLAVYVGKCHNCGGECWVAQDNIVSCDGCYRIYPIEVFNRRSS